MKHKYIGPASLLLIGALYGLSAVIVKYLATWLSAYQVVGARFFIAFVFAVLILVLTKQKFSLNKLDKKTLALFAITFPISAVLFTMAVFNTTVSLAIFSFYIANLVTSFVIGNLYFDEKISTNKKIALVCIVLAVIAFTKPLSGFQIQLGFIYGLISGIIQAFASTFQKIVGHSTNKVSLLIIQTLAGVILTAVVLVVSAEPFVVTLPLLATIILLLFGLMFLAISYLFLIGFKYTNLNAGSILVASELLFGPLFAFLLLFEKPSQAEVIGGFFTIAAILFANKTESKSEG